MRDIQKATGKLAASIKNHQPALSLTAIEAIFRDGDLNALQASRDAVGNSVLRLGGMESLLKDKVGPGLAPHFDELHQVLNEIDNVLNREIAKHAPSTHSAPGKKIEPQLSAVTSKPQLASTASSQGIKPMDTINSRQDVTRVLDQICLYYEKNEPASPVPLLLKRAARLVDKNFFEIIQDMAPDSISQIQKLIGEAKEEEP
jgi:type VI secretion system protein ImpA